MGPSLPRSPGTTPAGPTSLRLHEGAGHGALSHQGGGGHGTGHRSLICLDWTQEPHLQQPSAGAELAAKDDGLRVWRTGQRRKHRRTGKPGGDVTGQHPQDAPFSSRRTRAGGEGALLTRVWVPSWSRGRGHRVWGFLLREGKKGISALAYWGDRTPISGLLGWTSDCPVLAEILSSRYDPVVWPGSSPPYPTVLPTTRKWPPLGKNPVGSV